MNDANATRLALALIALGLLMLLAGACYRWQHRAAPNPGTVVVAEVPKRQHAEFGQQRPSQDARRVSDWVVATDDAQGRAFMVIDKKRATLYVFDASGLLVGSAPVLLGFARGDRAVPGIGQRPLSQVRPFERTTPAGRFVTEPGRNLNGEDVVWIDYDAAVSMHRVRATVAAEQRLQRLASRTSADNRISFGCINVPAEFYDAVVGPLFLRASGVAYVLPEASALHDVFGGLGVLAHSAAGTASVL